MVPLEELHGLVRDLWLTRHEEELEAEKAARRKGRSKSTKEMKLEELKLRESELYKTGMGGLKVQPFFLGQHPLNSTSSQRL